MSDKELYAFDRADAELTLLPMAARRALDVAGVHLSLRGWQRLSLEQRQQLIAFGAREQVASARVAALIRELAAAASESASAETRAVPALIEPAADEAPPRSLLDALGEARPLTASTWKRARALDRYVLRQLVERGKLERLAEAYDEIFGCQSSPP